MTTAPDRVLAAVGGSDAGEGVVDCAVALAAALGVPCHAVFIETPGTMRDGAIARRAADALAHATRLGASVNTETAHDVVGGLIAHLEGQPARRLVLGMPSTLRHRRTLMPALLPDIAARRPGLTVHLAPAQPDAATMVADPRPRMRAPIWHHAIAVGAVLLTLVVSKALSQLVDGRPLSLLFLFPVIAVAACLGPGPAITSVVASVLLFDLILLPPVMHLEPLAPVTIVLWIALGAVAVYTSLVTGALRDRVALSDRNAQESARIVAFAATLGQVATLEDTAALICEEFAQVLGVQTVLFREHDGQLVRAAARPEGIGWSPVAQLALDWAWTNGAEAGSGTNAVNATDWRLQPLTTLAVIALSRDDSRTPIRGDKTVLFATLVGQAALALERLVLEDRWRAERAAAPGTAA